MYNPHSIGLYEHLSLQASSEKDSNTQSTFDALPRTYAFGRRRRPFLHKVWYSSRGLSEMCWVNERWAIFKS